MEQQSKAEQIHRLAKALDDVIESQKILRRMITDDGK
jgi:hypothetical protein